MEYASRITEVINMKITVYQSPNIHIKNTGNGWTMTEEPAVQDGTHKLQTERKPKPKEEPKEK